MHSKIAAATLLGFASSSIVSAAPSGWYQNSGSWDYKGSGIRSYSPGSSPVSYSLTPAPTEVHPDGNKFRFPLSNDFPNPNQDEINDIEENAGGILPNGKAPSPPKNRDSITNLQLIAFNELFEVAFFTDLLKNVTGGKDGYSHPTWSQDFLVEILTTVQAQEELHLLNANGALKAFGGAFGVDPVKPCEYVFPTQNLDDAIALAALFTDVVLGTLQDVETIFANDQDNDFIRGVASVIGQEGEQEGFYRLFQGKRPSAQPFLTASARDFAFSALQMFVVPGSCPNIDQIPLKIFAPLNVLTNVTEPKDQTVEFSFTFPSNSTYLPDGYEPSSDFDLVFISGQDAPIIANIDDDSVTIKNGVADFKATFPGKTNLLFGLTIAAVVEGGKINANSNVDDVAKFTIAGPGLIETI